MGASRVRFEHALKLIKETDISLIDISKISGFSDYKFLNQMMKDKYKVTTLKYRKSLLEKKERQYFTITNSNFIKQLKQCIIKLEEDKKYQNLFNIETID
ncbi:MAG: hypothetical protein R6U15_08205 [Candidatus Izemoplasmatales bacterium]